MIQIRPDMDPDPKHGLKPLPLHWLKKKEIVNYQSLILKWSYSTTKQDMPLSLQCFGSVSDPYHFAGSGSTSGNVHPDQGSKKNSNKNQPKLKEYYFFKRNHLPTYIV